MDTDFIIVGAGSSGCVLAHELSCGGRFHVTVLEAGGSDNKFWIKTPLGYGQTFYDPRVNWMYDTAPDPGLNDRTDYWPRGKVLGGSSSINAMVYIRGHAEDYNDWAQSGAPGWSWADVKPWFEHIENGSETNENRHIVVSDLRQQCHALCTRFIAAGVSMGLPVNSDFNFGDQEGFGYYNMTIRNGRRHSAATAYLHPALRRPTVDVLVESLVSRINFTGNRASGVTFTQKGEERTLRCKREVIVAAGAINSPQLLQMSGIGPGDLLQSLDIPIVRANPNVGEHLQDHTGVNYYYDSRIESLNNKLRHWPGKLSAGLQYLMSRRGPLSLGINQAGAFVRTSDQHARPNLQVYFQPFSTLDLPAGQRDLVKLDNQSRFAVGYSSCRPTSRGSVHIRSQVIGDAPVIEANSLSTEHDVQEVREANQFILKLCSQPSLANAIEKRLWPSGEINADAQDELLNDYRERASTVFHPVGTCRMGEDAANSVVDTSLKVHGVHGLRVVDASVFPNIVSGNTNASTMMVGAKTASLIKREYT